MRIWQALDRLVQGSMLERLDQSRGRQRRGEVIDEARRRAIVTVFLKNANYRSTAELMRRIQDLGRDLLRPVGLGIDFAGDVAVSQAMIPLIVGSQASSLFLALLGALTVVSILQWSLRVGFIILSPALLAVVWTFGSMGWLGIPLGVATSMFCAIAMGIGVDYGIHFHASFQRALPDDPDAVAAALKTAGPPILADTCAIALGFGLLILSNVPANARLGLLVAFALLANCVLTLGGLGSLLKPKARRASNR